MDLKEINAPCQDCENRKVGCHSTCDAYITYLKKHREIRKKEARNNDYVGFRYMVVEDSFKRRRNKNKYIKCI